MALARRARLAEGDGPLPEAAPGKVALLSSIGGPAVKHDAGKPRYDLVPWEAVEGIAIAMTAGVPKYGPRNWERGLSWGRLFAATVRHLVAWVRGADIDPSDGKHHLDGALASLAMLRASVARNIGTDDRAPPPRETP